MANNCRIYQRIYLCLHYYKTFCIIKKPTIYETNSKYYVWAQDGNAGKVQIAISLTCPKIQLETVDVNAAFGDGMDFEAPQVVAPTKFVPAEITQEEKDNLEEMMKRLGL